MDGDVHCEGVDDEVQDKGDRKLWFLPIELCVLEDGGVFSIVEEEDHSEEVEDKDEDAKNHVCCWPFVVFCLSSGFVDSSKEIGAVEKLGMVNRRRAGEDVQVESCQEENVEEELEQVEPAPVHAPLPQQDGEAEGVLQ